MMPAEFSLGGVYMPGAFLLLALAAILFVCLDRLLHRFGFYRWIWHPALSRIAIFGILFGLTYLLFF